MPQTASQFHSQIATDFDALYLNAPAFRERFAVWTGLMDQFIALDARVFDLGCGSGVFSFYLAGKGCAVLGVDGAENMITICEARKQAFGLPNVAFYRAEIPLSVQHQPQVLFDAVISSSVMEYVEDLQGALANAAELLRPGGVLIVSLPNKYSAYRWLEKWLFRLTGRPVYYKYVHHVLTPKALNEVLAPLGFEPQSLVFYASIPLLKRILPEKYAANLFVGVYLKNK